MCQILTNIFIHWILKVSIIMGVVSNYFDKVLDFEVVSSISERFRFWKILGKILLLNLKFSIFMKCSEIFFQNPKKNLKRRYAIRNVFLCLFGKSYSKATFDFNKWNKILSIWKFKFWQFLYSELQNECTLLFLCILGYLVKFWFRDYL